MPSQKTIESLLRDNFKLTSELQSFINKIDEDKCFERPREETSLYPNLISLGVLTVDGTTVHVCPSDYLAYGFMMVHQKELLTNSIDLLAVTDFEQILKERLSTDIMTTELFRVTERISRLWVKSQHIDEGSDLTLFSSTPKTVQRFVRIFCDILPELSLSAYAIYTHFRQFVDAQVHLPPLIQALETYCQQHPAVAVELYIHLKQYPFEGDIHLRMVTQSGQNRQDWVSFMPQLLALTLQPEDQVLALSVMFRAQIDTDQQANQYLDLALSCDQSRDDVRRQVANVVQQILRFSQILAVDTVSRCFGLLRDLAQSESATVQGSVSGTIWLIEGFETERFSILMTLVQNSKLDSSLRFGKTNTIDTLLSTSFSRPECWFTVFDELVSQNAFTFKTEDFTGSLHELVLHSGKGLMGHLLPRLIHRQGEIRWATNRILNYIDHHAPHLRFSTTELSHLNSLQLYRLWLMVNESYRKPSFTIPLLSPLLDSTDELLIELIICHLEIASENYMGQVLETLEVVCQPDRPQHQRIFQRVNEHFESFLDYRRNKSVVNELNPILTQRTLFQQFDDLRRTAWSERMHQRLRTDSIAGLFKEVLLSKGGGWRNSKTGVTSQLGHVQTTFSLPRFYFLRPHEMDFEAKVSSSTEEWTDDMDLVTWITHE